MTPEGLMVPLSPAPVLKSNELLRVARFCPNFWDFFKNFVIFEILNFIFFEKFIFVFVFLFLQMFSSSSSTSTCSSCPSIVSYVPACVWYVLSGEPALNFSSFWAMLVHFFIILAENFI